MSIELVILGLSANQIAALRATPTLTDDVTTVALRDEFWTKNLASMQAYTSVSMRHDKWKERTEGIKARVVRSMSPEEREAFEARLADQD